MIAIENIKIVIGLDFGTSRSGYTYAFANDVSKSFAKTHWDYSPDAILYPKTATESLYDSNDKLIYWGWQANIQLAQSKQAGNTSLFRLAKYFKMKLHKPDSFSPENTPLMEIDGKQFEVIDLIGDYLKELRDMALHEISTTSVGTIQEEEILWCLTVPAIWGNANKEWMRIAAHKAGIIDSIDSNRLIFALEPIAAAYYVFQKNVENLRQIKEGETFMIVDCGGGTIDITSHKVTKDSKMEEVVIGNGGPFGSSEVNKYFIQSYLPKRLGNNLMADIARNHSILLLEIENKFERAKINYRVGQDLSFEFGPSFRKFLRLNYTQVQKKLADEQQGEDDALYITHEDIELIHNYTINGCLEEIENMFVKLNKYNIACDYVFLIGGFATSGLLQEKIMNRFSSRVKRKIICPPNPGGAVVEGAVMFAAHPESMLRRTRLTYGVGIMVVYKEGDTYPNEIDGKMWDGKRFEKLVHIGELLSLDEMRSTSVISHRGQQEITFPIFSTTKENIKYTNEEGVFHEGDITIFRENPPENVEKYTITVSFFFGQSEISIEVFDSFTKMNQKSQIRFAFNYS